GERSSLPEKSPRLAGCGGQNRRASSTGLSTGADDAGMRRGGVSPMAVHSCGGMVRNAKLPAKRCILPPSRPLLFWPTGGRRGRIGESVEHQVELSADDLWEEISGRLKEALSDGTYGKWFGDVHGLALEDETLVLSVPDEFTRDWIEGNFLSLIGAAV